MIKINLKKILKKRKITMTELHQKTGITINTISLFANNKSNGIQYNTLDRIVKALDVPVGDLIEYVEDIYKISILDGPNNDYYEMFHSKNFDVEKGKVLFNINDNKKDYLFSYTLSLTDTLNNDYDITLDAKLKYNAHKNSLIINVIDYSDINLPKTLKEYLNNFLEHPSQNTTFYKIISHFVVYQIMKNEYASVINIYTDIWVKWRSSGVFPSFYISTVESDSLSNKNESIVFLESDFKINLILKDPSETLNPIDSNIDLDLIPNIDGLSYLDLVYKINIDDKNHERTIFIC